MGDAQNDIYATHLDDLSLSTLVFTTDDQNLVVLSDGQRSGRVLLSELLGQRRRHDLSLQARRGAEMGLSGLSSVTGEACHERQHYALDAINEQ
jgi:hypothetical protein